AVAVLLRLAAALYMGNQVAELPGTFDQVSYDMLARRVVDGHGFTVAKTWWPITKAGEPTAHWSYLYTLYLAGVYALLGYRPLAARIIQAVLGGILMPWLACRLGQRIFNRRVGLVAAGLVAVYIYFVYYAAALMTETFYITAILWVFDLAGQLSAAPALFRWRWLLFGAALGVTVLLRQVFMLFIPVLFLWLLWEAYRAGRRRVVPMLGGLVLAGVVLLAAIAPWTVRNYRVFNRFVLLNTNAGYAFFWGNHPIHGYNFISILPADGPSYQDLIPPDLRQLDEAALDQALLKQGLATVQADPVRYLILSISRIKDYFKFWPASDSGVISNVSRVFSFGILWPFMIYGIIYSARRPRSAQPVMVYLFVVIYTAIHLLTWALIRYRLPVDALLLIFAAIALVDIRARLARRRPS
ncbi:MAG: ArnT family glycosyltransferase, partial [Anaerolineae bacterium]